MGVVVLAVRNTTLITVLESQNLNEDFKTDLIDFKEMNNGFIQVVQKDPPNDYTGAFKIEVSLLADASTFVPHPDSERILNADCNNFGWSFCCLPFRYARLCYTANTVTTGSIEVYARAKRT